VHPDDADVAGKVAPEQCELAGERDECSLGGARGHEARSDPEAESEGDNVRKHLERL
jgi:hypothetical protein